MSFKSRELASSLTISKLARAAIIGGLAVALMLPITSRAQMAQQAQNTSQNHQAEAQQALMAAFLFYQKCQDGDNGACYMTALALQQYNSLMATSGQSQTTAELSSTGGSGTSGKTINGATVNGLTFKDIAAGLKARGLTMNNGTASMNGGPIVPLDSSLATESGLAAAGLGPQQIAQTKAAMDEVKDKLGARGTKAASDFGVGGGGIGGGGSHAPGEAAAPAKSAVKGSVSGLSKNLGNDKIGVAGDDIFAMITRRYKANEKDLKE